MVGPCYLSGPIKFYSLNAVDTAINRCGIEPLFSREAQNILDTVYTVWIYGHPGESAGGQRALLLRESNPSPRYGAAYSSLPAVRGKPLVHPAF